VEIAVDEIPCEEAEPITVGQELKSARERMGMTLSELAAETRVPMRHLVSIEQSEFSALPGQTYTVGFVRSYARALGLDDIAVINALRAELSSGGHERYEAPLQNYDPTDPARVPSKTLAWTAAAVAALVLAGYLIFRSYALAPTAMPQTPALVATTAPAPTAPNPVATVSDDTSAENVGMTEQAPPPPATLVTTPNP
jgi:cytoskeleton protein RodZ